MSADFRLEKSVLMEELFDGRLKTFGITEIAGNGGVIGVSRCLFDGRNYLWVFGGEYVGTITRYNSNDPNKILNAISEQFDTNIFREDDPGFLGFKDEEEMTAFFEQVAKEDRDRLYHKIMNFLYLKPHGMAKDSYEMTEALIAHELVIEDPTYLEICRKDELIEAVEKQYRDKLHETSFTVPF
ncbi:hypothetical protein [Marinobacterium sp. xm-a-152]|jgi:hypothetical protein|uniref:hypothetical protein n=1 Tax=Marinobacterium sp. xm-a-152 TaxID=2497733 RepID=UPI001569AF50|nr:hypothetical protein [Marinobacterium sp. xm-a-152]NRP15228.1 hypothetical protein [Marinobacterium sp. xm-a-152]